MRILFLLALGLLFTTRTVHAQSLGDTTSYSLPEMLIKGNFPAYLQGIALQKKAVGTVHILNLDLPGRFPDLNPAEALQRLPGIALQRSHGEGRFVHIRGADPSLTTVQVNGEQIISPESKNRFLQFDLLPVDQLRAVEVWKTNRPDQDGDAIGGSINLLTQKPATAQPQWKGTIAGGFNPAAAEPNVQAQVGYSSKRYLLNASLWQDHRSTENLETIYGIRSNALGDPLYIQDVDLRHFDLSRRRLALSAEYRLPFQSNTGAAYARAFFVDFEEKNLRQRLRYRPGKGIASSGSDTIIQARIGRDVQSIRETERFVALQSGIEKTIHRWKLEAALAYSYGFESEPEGQQLDFYLPGVDLIQTTTRLKYPTFKIVNGASEQHYGNFLLNELEAEDEQSSDKALSAKIDLTRTFCQGNALLKMGAKARIRGKNSRATESIYDGYNGTLPIALPELLDDHGARSFLGQQYTFGQFIDWNKTKASIAARKGGFQLNEQETALESTAGNFGIAENSGAAYLLFQLQRSRWEWLAGIRVEYTDFQYAADQVSIDSSGKAERLVNGRKFEGNYTLGLPCIMAKYVSANHVQWRAYLGASYARPTFAQLAPYELFDQLNQTVTAGNPDLKPVFAWNLDFSVEKPISRGGSISLGVFAKQLNHFIFTQQRRESRLWRGLPIDVLTTMPLNGAFAWLAGTELAWQKQLTFLPGAWSGLGVYANYSYTWSRATAAEEEPSGVEAEGEGFRLPGQAAHIGNLALWYDQHRWSGRLAFNAQSDYLLEAAEPEEAESQLIYGGSVQLDAMIGYNLKHNITLFAEGMNLLNTPLRYYTGDKDHPSKLEQYGAWGRIGAKFLW